MEEKLFIGGMEMELSLIFSILKLKSGSRD
jgi:hypothetical protein